MWLAAAIIVALIGAAAAELVKSLLPKPVLKATLDNIDLKTRLTLAEFKASTETALAVPRDPVGGGSTLAATSFLIASIAPRVQVAQTVPEGDADRDGVSDAQDRCSNSPRGAPVDGTGCPLRTATAQAKVERLTNCSEKELDRALDEATRGAREQRTPCTSVVDLAEGLPGGDSKDPKKRYQVILSVLRSTRSRPGRRGRPEGVAVSFDLTLEGFKGRKVEARWSLYNGGRPVSEPWLKDHPVLSVKGESDEDKANPEFWLPLPKQHGRYSVRIEVFDENDTKLTSGSTKPFR